MNSFLIELLWWLLLYHWILKSFSEYLFCRTPLGDCLFHVQVLVAGVVFYLFNYVSSIIKVNFLHVEYGIWQWLQYGFYQIKKIEFFVSGIYFCSAQKVIKALQDYPSFCSVCMFWNVLSFKKLNCCSSSW